MCDYISLSSKGLGWPRDTAVSVDPGPSALQRESQRFSIYRTTACINGPVACVLLSHGKAFSSREERRERARGHVGLSDCWCVRRGEVLFKNAR